MSKPIRTSKLQEMLSVHWENMCYDVPIESGLVASTYEGIIPLDEDEWPRLPQSIVTLELGTLSQLDKYMSQEYPKLPWHLWYSFREMDDGWPEHPRPSVVGHALAVKQHLLRHGLLDMMERTGDKVLAEELQVMVFSYLAVAVEVELGENPKAEHIETVIESMFAGHPSSNLRRVARTAFMESIIYSNTEDSITDCKECWYGPDLWLIDGISVQTMMLSEDLFLKSIDANIVHLQLNIPLERANYYLKKRFRRTHDFSDYDNWLSRIDDENLTSTQLASVCPTLQTLTVTLKSSANRSKPTEADLNSALRRLSTGVFGGHLQLFFEGILHITSSKPSLRIYIELLSASLGHYPRSLAERYYILDSPGRHGIKSQGCYHGVLLRTKLDRSRPVNEMLEEFHAVLEEASKITLAREEYERAQENRIMSDELEEVEA